MLTAAVEALHVQHPGRYVTDVRTPCPDLWKANPFITPLEDADPAVQHIDCEYPLIHQSNELPYHFIHGYVQYLAGRLNTPLSPVAFRGNIHLHPSECQPPPLLAESVPDGQPFWIICAGGKYDFTIKWWHRRRWQEVVDHYQGRVTFVQVGEQGHYHPPLRGVIDMRGRTSLRDLIRLVYHAAGILCPVTLLMHLAAAVPCRPGKKLRPCVVVAGGREPAHWEAYPGHQFLHTIGSLLCCAAGGCWRARTVPLGDGSDQDAASRLCVRPRPSGLPQCMELITPQNVIRAMETYSPAMPREEAPELCTSTSS
jgi:ADP-heptose:LPS heptosyltransferase